MHKSRRARRMERHHKRYKQVAGFSLISLMDIFTILVFFLLVSSSNVETLTNAKSVALPKSISEIKPKETALVMVTADKILFQGREVASIAEVSNDPQIKIVALNEALQKYFGEEVVTGGTIKPRGEVTIMADKKIPFRLLKKVMSTCILAGYEKISLAVLQKSNSE